MKNIFNIKKMLSEKQAKQTNLKKEIEDIKRVKEYLHANPYHLSTYKEEDGSNVRTFLSVAKEIGDISDGYHTFNELYDYRMLYNAAFFNLLKDTGIKVYKSHKHHDGEECFGGGWFIVMAELPTGQISNHYENHHWDLFDIPEQEVADEWDGHTPKDAAERLKNYCLKKN